MKTGEEVFVVAWEYQDKSAHGIVGVFSSASESGAVFKALTEYGATGTTYTEQPFRIGEIQ